MVRVFIADNPIEAKFVKDFLESAGIESVVRGEHLFALRGGVPMTVDTLPSVWLLYEEDVEEAERLLTRLQARSRMRLVAPSDEERGRGRAAADSEEHADAVGDE